MVYVLFQAIPCNANVILHILVYYVACAHWDIDSAQTGLSV